MSIKQVVLSPVTQGKKEVTDRSNSNVINVDDKALAPDQQKGGDVAFSEGDAARANHELVEHMKCVLNGSLGAATELRQKLQWTYWIVVTLTVLMFGVGLMLISTPLWALFGVKAPDLNVMLAAVGVGFLDFVALFLYGPINRIKKLMGDISQLTVSFDSFQVQVAMLLFAADSRNRESLVETQVQIGAAAQKVLGLIEQYYERSRDKQQTNP